MMIRRSAALAALSAALFLAGCAGDTTGTGSPGGSSDAASSAAPPPSSAPVVDPSAPGGSTVKPKPGTSGVPKPEAGAVETLTGQVIAGVEPGCLVLTGPRGSHLLIVSGDEAKTVKVGATVTVTGSANPGMVTTCQQGTPFVVTAAKAS
jgi:hypothetical protein